MMSPENSKDVQTSPLSEKIRNTNVVYEYTNSKKKPLSLHDMNQLFHTKIGGQNGYYYVPFLESRGYDLDLSIDEIECLSKLKADKINYAIFDPLVLDYYLDQYMKEEKEAFSPTSIELPLQTFGDALMLSSYNASSQEFISAFNHVLEEMKQSGELKEIFSLYKLSEELLY